MALGRTFLEAMFKGLRALEHSEKWYEVSGRMSAEEILNILSTKSPDRIPIIIEALNRGIAEEKICEITDIDPWFINMFKKSTKLIEETKKSPLNGDILRKSKMAGFSDD